MALRCMLASLLFSSLAIANPAIANPVLPILGVGATSKKTSSSSSTTATVTSSVAAAAIKPVTTTLKTRPAFSQSPYGGPAAAQYSGPAFLKPGSNLSPALSQKQQNGLSLLGLTTSPRYGGPLGGLLPGLPWGLTPPWLGNPLLPLCYLLHGLCPPSSTTTKTTSSIKGSPTSSSVPSNCVQADPGKVPTTGITRYYTWDVTYQTIAPDGVQKQGIVINGGFPGPTIEANWGDWIEVTVTNGLTTGGNPEGLTIHWHGLLQKATPFMDGVPSVSQCPIAPGNTFTYKFQADQYGTTWYHSHYSAQYTGGVYGAIIIHGPNDGPDCAGYDYDLGPVMVGDWYHAPYYTLVQETMNTTSGLPPMSNNNLVNGKANYPCANTTLPCTPNAGLTKFSFQSGKKYRMRLINPSSDALQKISIDNHTFTVIAYDFTPIQPIQTDLITLAIGQRADVIVQAVGSPTGSYWFRSTLAGGANGCSLPDGISPNAMAVISYQNANVNTVPTTTSSIDPGRLTTCSNDALNSTTPLFARNTNVTGELLTQTFNIDFINNGTNFLWTVNNISARVDYNVAQLAQAVQGTLNPPADWNVYNLGSANTLRIIVTNSFIPVGHPMHMHGHEFQVLAEGFGTWDGTITNPSNPMRRDVQFLQKAAPDGTPSYTVLQLALDNPSINIFHCHLAWHVSGGLYVALLERPDLIPQHPIPQAVTDGCTQWNAFTNKNVPDQIDSGI